MSKKLTAYEVACLWAEIGRQADNLARAVKCQGSIEMNKAIDELQDLRLQLRSHHAAVVTEYEQRRLHPSAGKIL